MDCRKAIDRLQTFVQRLTSDLEKCRHKAELPSSSLIFSFKYFIGAQKRSAIKKSKPFSSPPVPYRFQIMAKLEKEELHMRVNIFCGANDQPMEISLEVYVIHESADKVSKEKTSIVLHSQIGNDGTITFDPFKLFPRRKWVTNNHLQIFCRINQVVSLKCEGL